jgi:hypothetical protein
MQTSRASCKHAGKVSLMILTKLLLRSARAMHTMHALFFIPGVEEGSTIFLVAFKRVLSTMLEIDGEEMPAAPANGEEMLVALAALAETALMLIGLSANLLR